MTLLLAIAIAYAPPVAVQASVRARVAAEDEANRKVLAEIRFPGFDVSDDAVAKSSVHYCGQADECRSEFLEARNRIIRSAALDRKQPAALRILQQNSEAGFTDWRFALTLYDATFHQPRPYFGGSITTTCHAYASGRSISSTCRTYVP